MRSTALQAINARKTECRLGHPFSTDNTYVDKQGRRTCRTCNNATSRLRNKRMRDRRKYARIESMVHVVRALRGVSLAVEGDGA